MKLCTYLSEKFYKNAASCLLWNFNRENSFPPAALPTMVFGDY